MFESEIFMNLCSGCVVSVCIEACAPRLKTRRLGVGIQDVRSLDFYCVLVFESEVFGGQCSGSLASQIFDGLYFNV